MMGRCAWCGDELPAKRRGRKGARAFCSRVHKDAFNALAVVIGLSTLDGADVPAQAVMLLYDWHTNSAPVSASLPPPVIRA